MAYRKYIITAVPSSHYDIITEHYQHLLVDLTVAEKDFVVSSEIHVDSADPLRCLRRMAP